MLIAIINQEDTLIEVLFQSSVQPTLIAYADSSIIIRANDACLAVLGLEHESDLVGSVCTEALVKPELYDKTKTSFETQIYGAGKKPIWISITEQYFRYNDEDLVIKRFNVLQDRFQSVEQQEYSRNLYNAIFNQAPDAKLLRKLNAVDGKMSYSCNEKALSLFEINSPSVFYEDGDRFLDGPNLDVKQVVQKGIKEGYLKKELRMRTYSGMSFWGMLTMKKIAVGSDEYLLTSIQDISEQKQTTELLLSRERELQEKELYLRSIINTLPNPFFVKNLDGSFALTNQAFKNLIGLDKAGSKQISEFDVHSEEKAQQFLHKDEEVIKSGKTMVFNESFTNLYGETKELVTYKTPFFTANNAPQIIGAIIDITELNAAQKQLAIKDEILSKVFHNSTDAIFMLNEKHEMIDVNTTAEKMFQRSREQLMAIGGNALQKYPFTMEELIAAGETIDKQGIFQKEVEYIRADGSEFWGLISISHFTVESSYYVLVRVVDIDVLKRTEKQLEYNRDLFTNVFDTTEDGIFIMTTDWEIKYVNNGALLLFQHDREHFIHNYASVLNDMLVEPFNEEERQDYMNIALNNEIYQKELEYYRKDGSTFYGLLTTTPFQSESDTLILIRIMNIDKIRQVENELELKNEIFSTLFNKSADAYLLLDDKDVIIEVNQAVSEMFGLQTHYLIGVTGRLEQITQFSSEKCMEVLQVLDDVGFYQNEIHYYLPDGSRFWGLLSISIIDYKDSFLSLSRVANIDHLKQYEAELAYKNEIFEKVYNNSTDAIFLLNAEENITEVNKRAMDMFLMTSEELMAMRKGANLQKIPYTEKDFAVVAYSLETFGQYQAELEFVRNDKTTFWGLLSITRFTISGLDYQLARIVDIDKLIQIESELDYQNELFEKIFANSTDAIFLVGKNRKIIDINETVEKMFLREKASLIGTVGTLLQKVLFTPDELHKLNNFEEKGTAFQAELEYVRGDGSTFWGLFTITNVETKKGLLAVVRVVDIDNLKKFEIEQTRSLHERTILIKEVHHRVKNNLAVVSGLLQIQSSYFKDPEIKTAFRDSQNRIRGMALIHEMLYKSVDFANIDFGAYIRSLVNYIQRTYSMPCPVTIQFELEPISLNLITAIPCGLIINEAVSNAFKHAFDGRDSGNILIGFRSEDNLCHLEVKDNGLGMKDTVDLENSSLGMTLIYELSSQLHGDLQLYNDSGTTLKLSFYQKTSEEEMVD